MSRFFVAWCLHGGILLGYGNGALAGYYGCGMLRLWNITGTEQIALRLWNVVETEQIALRLWNITGTEQLGKSRLQTVEWCKLRRGIVELGQKETPRGGGVFCC